MRNKTSWQGSRPAPRWEINGRKINVPSSHGFPESEVNFNGHCHIYVKMKIYRTREKAVANQGCSVCLHSYSWMVTISSGCKNDICTKHGLPIMSSDIAATPDTEHQQKSHKQTFPIEVFHFPVPILVKGFHTAGLQLPCLLSLELGIYLPAICYCSQVD